MVVQYRKQLSFVNISAQFVLFICPHFWNLAKYLHEHSDEGAHDQVGRVVLVVRDPGEGGAEGHGEEGQLQEGHHEGLPRDGVDPGLEFCHKGR